MAEYNLTDKEQAEMIKKWWNDYGKTIAVAVIIGFLIALGWRYWRQHKLQNAQKASALYGQLGVAYSKKQMGIAEKIAAQLMQHYQGTPYATMAALWWAKTLVNNKNYNAALQKTEWVQKNSRVDSFRQIARLRTARIYLYQKNTQAALLTLKTVDDATYQPLIEALKGDIYNAMNKTDAAKKAYKKAQSGMKAADINSPLLNMKAAQ